MYAHTPGRECFQARVKRSRVRRHARSRQRGPFSLGERPRRPRRRRVRLPTLHRALRKLKRAARGCCLSRYGDARAVCPSPTLHPLFLAVGTPSTRPRRSSSSRWEARPIPRGTELAMAEVRCRARPSASPSTRRGEAPPAAGASSSRAPPSAALPAGRTTRSTTRASPTGHRGCGAGCTTRGAG